MEVHNKQIDEAFAKLNSSAIGITDLEAENRLKTNGLNRLESKKQKSVISIFLQQFKDFMILVLLAAAVV